MNKKLQQRLRKQLQAELDRLQPGVQTMTEETLGPSGGQGETELSNVPMHLADRGTDEYMHELNTTLLAHEEFLLSEIRQALARLDQGAFGRCESCQAEIGEERLLAIPYSRHCIACASSAHQAPAVNLNSGRPRSPAETLADEEEMDIKRRDEKSGMTDMVTSQQRGHAESDVHAAGVPGGGGATGGLAGTTKGDGSPDLHDLEEEMGSGNFDAAEGQDENRITPVADVRGRPVSGTPVTRR